MKMRSYSRITTMVLLLLALAALTGTADNKSVGPKKATDLKPPQGPDLTVLPTTFGGNCLESDCSQCPTQVGNIYVKNIGNKASLAGITITVKRNNQVLHTWAAPALAPHASVVVGNVTSFMWSCGANQFDYYSFTVDTQNAVAETNELNNTVTRLYNANAQKTIFQ